jgi:hypothetical protein
MTSSEPPRDNEPRQHYHDLFGGQPAVFGLGTLVIAFIALLVAFLTGDAARLPLVCSEAVSVLLKSPKVRFQQLKYSLGPQCVYTRCT